jgi:hypothetical protein
MQVVIANRLRDGLVAFLDEKGGWAHFISEARVARSEEESREMLAIAERCEQNNEIVGAELIDVSEEGGELAPTSFRELIRAKGPTIRVDLGKQAEG